MAPRLPAPRSPAPRSLAPRSLAPRSLAPRSLAWILVTACALAAAPGAALGDGPPPVVEDRAGGTIDWTRGLIIADGAAAADLRARAPDVARVGAERRARERARDALASLAEGVALASGGDVGSAIEGDEAAAGRLGAAAERAVEVGIDYASDGSVRVRLGLPLEAVRAALAGEARALPGGAEGGTTGVLVRAGDALGEPVLGLTLVAGDERYAAPVAFAHPPATGDRRLGGEVSRTRATGRDGPALEVAMEPAELAGARAAGALVIVVLDPAPGGG